MKIFPVLSLALVLQLAQLAAGQVVDFNRALSVSYAARKPSAPVKFLSNEEQLPSASLLSALSDRSYKPSRACFTDDEVNDVAPTTVLIAVSKCLKDDELEVIKKWVRSVTKNKKLYDFHGVSRVFKFEIAGVPGDCKEAYENKGYSYDEEDVRLLSREVSASDIARLEEHFGEIGRVLGGGVPEKKVEGPAPTKTETPISVLSFTDNYASYVEVDLYERKFEIENVINFNICKKEVTKCKNYETSITLDTPVDIFLYNPFVVVRQLNCARSLKGGVPVSYLDDDGNRQCFCTCPAGSSEQTGRYGRPACVKDKPEVCPCVWSNSGPYTVNVCQKEQAQNSYGACAVSGIATTWKVGVPFPSDNYVADARTNINEKAFVELNARNTSGELVIGGTGKFPWKDYQTDNVAKIDALTFPGFGKYSLSLYAKDYFGDATCEGCVAIVDKVRPHSSPYSQCPKPICHDEANPEAATPLTQSTLEEADALVDKFYNFGLDAVNDACSSSSRCDDNSFEQRDFFQKDYTKSYDFGAAGSFFELTPTIDAFVGNSEAKTNPLVKSGERVADDCEDPVKPGKCTRCVKLSTTLKEWWTQYVCGSEYEEPKCEGTETCTFEQCLTLDGETFATATATVNPTIKKESDDILKALEQDAGYQSDTQIHRAVQCPSLHEKYGDDGYSGLKCSYSATVPSLVDVASSALFDIGKYAKVEDFVFWRYKIDSGKWKLWDSGESETFVNAKSTIYVEAWTQCGIVKKFVFTVHLHPHTDVHVCEFFPNMWYQTSVSRLPISDTICTYPKSDFAELTFDFRANIGLEYVRSNLQMHVADVKCEMRFKDHEYTEILHSTKELGDVIERFAVEAINNPSTDEFSKVDVKCKFTYKQFDNSLVCKTCERSFTIQDCTTPDIDTPPRDECEYDNCAGKALPGAYEACGGTVVKAVPASAYDKTPPTTVVVTGERECCSSCDSVKLTCNSIIDSLDGDDDIKRCEPVEKPGYGYGYGYGYGNSNGNGYGYTNALMSAGHALVNASQEHAVATGLLSASALVAIVALVVVKRRHAANKRETTVEDAYYPLLH